MLLLLERELLHDRISLKLEHFPQEFSLEFPDEKVYVKVLDTSFSHRFTRKRKILFSNEVFLHKFMHIHEIS